jgi:alkaline phosphatase
MLIQLITHLVNYKNKIFRINVLFLNIFLGLFNVDHLDYDHGRNNSKEPSLMEMTQKAIQILKKNKNGFFLMVESGRMDHAHHNSNAFNALHDYVAFEKAIETALNMTSKQDTMITVTADHSHVFTVGGYARRGNPIFGKYTYYI